MRNRGPATIRSYPRAAHVCLVLVAWFTVACGADRDYQPTAAATHVGRTSCARCHARQHELWSGSHHDLAMQEASAETVLGDFHDARFKHQGVGSRFYTKGAFGFLLADRAQGEQ